MVALKNYKAAEEVASFIAETDPAKVLAFRPSSDAVERVTFLIDQEKADQLSEEERVELDHYLQIEHLMRMAKIFARKYSGR